MKKILSFLLALLLSAFLSGCTTPSEQNTSIGETPNSMQQEPISSDISSSTSDSDPQHSSLPEIVPLQKQDGYVWDTGKMVSITFALLEDPTALVILCMQTIQVGKFFIYAHKQTAHITIPPAPAILFPAPAVFLPW